MKEVGLTGKVLSLEPYKDPDEFIKNLGKEEFQKRIDEAENSFFFEIRILQREYNINDPDEKTKFHREIAKKIAGFSEEMERDNYIQAVADKYYMSIDALRNMVNNIGEQKGLAAPIQRAKSGIQSKMTAEDGIKREQRLLLTWLVERRELYAKLKPYISVSDFTDELYGKVAEQLFEGLENGICEPAAIVSLFQDEEEQHEVAKIFHTNLPPLETKADKEKAIRDIVFGVKENSLAFYSEQMGRDIGSLQKVIDGKKALEELKRIHITLDE